MESLLIKECKKRFNELKLNEDYWKKFESGIVVISDKYDLPRNHTEEEQKYIDYIEPVIKGKVIYGNRSSHSFGEILNLFIVSGFEEDWNLESNLTKDNLAIVYAVNLTCPECSETGTIPFVNIGGDLYRNE